MWIIKSHINADYFAQQENQHKLMNKRLQESLRYTKNWVRKYKRYCPPRFAWVGLFTASSCQSLKDEETD